MSARLISAPQLGATLLLSGALRSDLVSTGILGAQIADVTPGPTPAPPTLLLESGDALLLESGDRLLLETP